MMMWYNKQGEKVNIETWSELMEDPNYKRVAETTLPNGKWVSTVLLGIDHSFGSGPPLIFETMVFESKGNLSELDCDRYSTEAEALAGHHAMVALWEAKHEDQTEV